jgi:hypothetical protein
MMAPVRNYRPLVTLLLAPLLLLLLLPSSLAAAATARPDGPKAKTGTAAALATDGSVTTRPKTGCPYLRAMQVAQDAGQTTTTTTTTAPEPPLSLAALLPLRGISDSVVKRFYELVPKNPPPDSEGLALDVLSRGPLSPGGTVEHHGSLGRSPEFILADGAVSPPRNDPLRLPFLLSLLKFDAEDSTLTSADLGRVSRLADALDEHFFAANSGRAGAMGRSFLSHYFIPAGEAVFVHAHLSDDKGLVKRGEYLDLIYDGALSTAAEGAGGKAGGPLLIARTLAGLATRKGMPWLDKTYKQAAAAIAQKAAAAPGGSLLDPETGLVRV